MPEALPPPRTGSFQEFRPRRPWLHLPRLGAALAVLALALIAYLKACS